MGMCLTLLQNQQPGINRFSPSIAMNAIGSLTSTALSCLRYPLDIIRNLGKAHYVCGWGHSGWYYERDVNPLNYASPPAIEEHLRKQIKILNSFAPPRIRDSEIRSIEDIAQPTRLKKTEWTRERTDRVCAKFCEKSYIYTTALWVYQMTHGGKNPDNDKILIHIVKKATTPNPQTGKKPDLWTVISSEFLLKAFSNQTLKARYFFFIGSPLIKKFIYGATFNTISGIRTELTKNDGKNFSEIFAKSVKKLSSFFEDYLKVIKDYALDDPNAHGARDEYIKHKLQEANFTRDSNGRGYTEDQLYEKFSEVAIEMLVPRLTWTKSIWEARKLPSWHPASTLGKAIKEFLIVCMHVICAIGYVLAWLFQSPINRWFIPYTVRAYLPDHLRGLVQHKAQAIQGNAYEHAINKILIAQFEELLQQEKYGEIDTPLIDESTRKDLQTFVKLTLETLQVEPKKTRVELLAFFEEQKKEPIIFMQPLKFLSRQKNEYIQKAMQQALQDAMVNLYVYFTNPNRMEMVLCKAMEVINAPFSDEPFPTEADRETARKELKRLARAYVGKTVHKAVKNAMGEKTSVEKEQLTREYLNNFRRNMLKHLAFINKDLEEMSENPEGKIHTLEALYHFKQLIETVYNEIQEMESDATVSGYIKKRTEKKTRSYYRETGDCFERTASNQTSPGMD